MEKERPVDAEKTHGLGGPDDRGSGSARPGPDPVFDLPVREAREKRGIGMTLLRAAGLSGSVFLLFQAGVFPPEALNPTGGVDDFLLSRHEGVALGTNFDLDVFSRGLRLDDVPADTGDRRIFVGGMNVFLHLPGILLREKKIT